MQEEKEKGEQLLQQINSETHGALSRFLVESNFCPICIEKGEISHLQTRMGETICIKCGYVAENISYDQHIPYGQTRTPTNQLAFGRGQGNTLGRKGLFYVLAHGIGQKDLPLRAKQIGIITQKLDHPKITTMLRLGRKRCHEWGFDDHKQPKNILFSNYLGRMLRKIGADIILTGTQTRLGELVDACFVLSLKATEANSYQAAMDKLHVPTEFLNRVSNRYEELKMVYT